MVHEGDRFSVSNFFPIPWPEGNETLGPTLITLVLFVWTQFFHPLFTTSMQWYWGGGRVEANETAFKLVDHDPMSTISTSSLKWLLDMGHYKSHRIQVLNMPRVLFEPLFRSNIGDFFFKQSITSHA